VVSNKEYTALRNTRYNIVLPSDIYVECHYPKCCYAECIDIREHIDCSSARPTCLVLVE